MKVVKEIFMLMVLTVAMIVLLFACSAENNGEGANSTVDRINISDVNTNKFNIAEFERNRDLWTSKNIQNYRMIIGATGFLTNFPEQVSVEINSRRPVSIKSLSTTGKNYTDAYKGFDTVEKLFVFVKNEGNRDPEKLDVKYHETLGYPLYINLDRSLDSDDELTLAVDKLEVIK